MIKIEQLLDRMITLTDQAIAADEVTAENSSAYQETTKELLELLKEEGAYDNTSQAE